MCLTLILQEGYPRSLLSQRGVPQLRLPSFTTWTPPLKAPGAPRVRGSMKIPVEMAEQRSGVNLALPVPRSRHFDVMAALCFVMLRSCQIISGPVTAVSARLLGLTGPVMEPRLNKRVSTFPALGRSAFIHGEERGEKKGGEGFYPPCREKRRRRRACHPSATVRKDESRRKNM